MNAPHRGAGERVLPLLAVAAGVSAANLYYAQPLAAEMARSLHVAEGAVGIALTATQVGYATGMVLLVPLGDARERRSVVVLTAIGAAVALVALAASPTFSVLVATSLFLGFASSLPQMVVPFAVGLVEPERRGHAIGMVMSGLLAGILLSRTVSGVLASAIGWRLTFAAAAAGMAALAVVLRATLPEQRPTESISWGAALRSLVGVVRTQPVLRKHALVGALGFAGFSVFWSTLSFQLATLGHGSRVAGLFGVFGLAGVLVAPVVGRVAGRVPPSRINAAGLLAVAVSFVLLGFAPASLVAMAVAAVVLDAGSQASHLANQTVILGLSPELRNRLNAVYMVTYFAGGAAGTAIAAAAWARGGYTGVCIVGVALSVAGIFATALRARG